MNEFDENDEERNEREVERENIRRRVRNASVGENTTFIPAKPSPTIHDEGHKRVAVYARVSTSSLDQVSSIENQSKYYSEKVDKNPEWELQEIYSDEGKSGTSMRKRTEFQRMLRDAIVDQKMDIILCASVSRFARNMSDCMEQVRELKTANPSHPVGVFFETENIYTLNPDSGQALAVHAMLADWESANKSRRMILSYDQRICTGQYPVSDLLGYRHTKEGQLIIQPEEARTVRLIFLGRLALLSYSEIAQILTEKKRPTLTGRTDWNESMVSSIMENERRWGDLQARKTIVVDYVKGKSIKNDRIRDAAYVTNHHEGIVSPDIARAVKFIGESRGLCSVPEMRVVDSGALKGFVNVNPGWAGISDSALTDACRSVYTDEEFASLTKTLEPSKPPCPACVTPP